MSEHGEAHVSELDGSVPRESIEDCLDRGKAAFLLNKNIARMHPTPHEVDVRTLKDIGREAHGAHSVSAKFVKGCDHGAGG